MTHEQRAAECLKIAGVSSEAWMAMMHDSIAAAIRAAVEEEREACAKIAERDALTGDWPPARDTAAEIRARCGASELKIVARGDKTGCQCRRCIDERRESFDGVFPKTSQIMILCPTCGNKRCPHAKWHGFKCTNSNKVGQVGEPLPEPPRAASQTAQGEDQTANCACSFAGKLLKSGIGTNKSPSAGRTPVCTHFFAA